MTGKKLVATVVLSSASTAFLTVLGMQYYYAHFGSRVNVHNGPQAQLVNYDDFMLSGKLQRTFLSTAPTHFTTAAEAITPSVVNIRALQNGYGNFFSNDGTGASSGSGVIVSADGYIVTNEHVVKDATEISVTLDDKREFTARVVGTDPSTDIALLKIEASKLWPVRMGNSDSVRVGEWVLAVGNPFNLESTVTAGIVSAKGRSINILEENVQPVESFIQTDAAVNPGNSGGALVNTNGELIGINTAIITKTGRYEGYSFAIPINLARKIISDLKAYGEVKRGYLGVEINDINAEIARRANYDSMNGVVISGVTPKSAADEAGLRQGDIITGINGIKVKNQPELLEQVAVHGPGETVRIDYFRSGQWLSTTAVLKNKANTTAAVAKSSNEPFDFNAFRSIGISDLRPLSAQEVAKLGIKGVKVVRIEKGSSVEKTNMDEGFIITKVNDVKVVTVQDVVNKLATLRGKVTLSGMYEGYPQQYIYTFTK